MIALGIRYLTGYAVATNLSRQQPEWPPHPGRVFLALAAAYFESGGDAEERAALEWLEAAGAPALYASEADERSEVRAYVPVNDVHGGIEKRLRQERAFPRVRPHEDCMYLVWEKTPPPETRAALERICGKVTRVGHSMSAVQMWVAENAPETNWKPDGMGNVRMRVATGGTLRSLEAAFNGEAIAAFDALEDRLRTAKGKEKARWKAEKEAQFPDGRPEWRRPELTQWQGYARTGAGQDEASWVDGPFDDRFVVLAKEEGPALGLESTQQLTGALRNAAMKAAGDSVPEWLSGHDGGGAPSRRAHVAFFPLPYVGAEYADGHVLGMGIAIPRELEAEGPREEELRRVLGPLFFDVETGEEREIRLWLEGVWKWKLRREQRERPPVALRRETWTRPSRIWASVTPVVLHHYPKRRDGHVAEIVRQAFVSALLPEPQAIQVTPVSALAGAGHAKSMPAFVQGGEGLCRYHTHVVVRFAKKVRGPVLVGRGRFRGYGLFRPLEEGEKL